MITISDENKYYKHLEFRKNLDKSWFHELFLPILLLGSIGAITWAMRGTSGWGGVDGTVIPGLTWAILWFYLCYRKGIDVRNVIFWLGLGLALGGELGYGQYTAWIRGMFYAGDNIYSISPWMGYLWFTICGIGWAAAGGIILGWTLGKPVSKMAWGIRSFLIIVLLILLFAWQFVDWLSLQMLELFPGLLFPNTELGLYSGELDRHLERTVYTNTQNFAVLVWWLIALAVAYFQKDKTTLFIGFFLGAGFGIGFMQSAVWCLGYGFAPNYIDWWKMWELNSGFNLGLLYAITLYWAIRKLDKDVEKSNNDLSVLHEKSTLSEEKNATLFLAISGTILLYFVGFEYFAAVGIFLTSLYFILLALNLKGISKSLDSSFFRERRNKILLIFSAFLLLFLLFHGSSSRAGIILGLYSEKSADQYAWPMGRVILFLPFAFYLIVSLLSKIRKILFTNGIFNFPRSLPERMVDLMTLIGFLGALTIWPAKIGVIYAFFIILSVFALIRLNKNFDQIDNELIS